MKMQNTDIVRALCACLSVLVAVPASADSIGNIGDTRLKGYLGERLDRMIERHIGGTDVDYITAPFLSKWDDRSWRTEFWGKYMHSAVPYAVYSGSPKVVSDLDRGIDRILESQEPGGYIGNYRDEKRCESWDVWGMKYTMMGLMHYYDWARRRGNGERACRVLSACRRLCDYVIGEIGPGGRRGKAVWQTGNWSGYASSSILEPVVWLYRRVAEAEGEAAAKKYIDFAAFIVKGMSEPEPGPRLVDLALKGVSVADRNGYGNVADVHGGYVMRHNRWKAYEMMSCYQGIIEFCRVLSANPRLASAVQCPASVEDLRRAVLMSAEDIAREEVNLAGGCSCSEAWFHGARKQHIAYERLQETCVTTTWMRFCEALLEETGDPKWADQIERTFYNACLGALKADGSEFAGYTPLSGSRYHGQHHCSMHTDCCTANGPRGFLCFLRKFFVREGRKATFNFYASAMVDGFDVYSLYPRQNTVRIISRGEGPLDLRLRIPAWSAKTVVKFNGKELENVKSGSYFTVSADWKLGDSVEVAFDMPVVTHTLGDVDVTPGAFPGKNAKVERLPHFVAFTRGPVLLARDSRFADGDLTEPFRHRQIRAGCVMPTFAPVRSPSDDIWMAFSATLPIGAHSANPEGALPETVFFCDFASACNTWRRADYYRTWFPIEWGPTE